ncbi:hypothetical protein EW145_g6115 [Phellinidium pouzarii]|uniref:Kinase n=1 Tax=Phellinidium pouzarii TaxID=167371 RepID=A0A4S4L2F5_9AGAM|nr:hypothetical protein EW145_g6115 [Phellinidium pouzarii]
MSEPTDRTPIVAAAAAAAVSAGEAAFHALSSQVGGHPGVLASEDGSLIVKESVARERAFYELLAQEDPRIAPLQPFVPLFYGTLRLEGRVHNTAALEPVPGVAAVDVEQGFMPASVVEDKDEFMSGEFSLLENVSSSFSKPNILDIKLGTILYDEDALPEKKARMIETAKNTTSLETGVRLTGFQVYDYSNGAHEVTPKSYGKSIKASELPEGIRRFFPLSSSSNIDTASAPEPVGIGLPRGLLLPIMRGIVADTLALRAALASTEVRAAAMSLLVVYEADWARAHAGLEEVNAAPAPASELGAASVPVPMASTSIGNDAAAGDADLEGSGYEEDVEDAEDEDEDEEEQHPPYVVKIIDFAHTRLVPGSGPDESVLKGLDTTISLFEGRIKEVECE